MNGIDSSAGHRRQALGAKAMILLDRKDLLPKCRRTRRADRAIGKRPAAEMASARCAWCAKWCAFITHRNLMLVPSRAKRGAAGKEVPEDSASGSPFPSSAEGKRIGNAQSTGEPMVRAERLLRTVLGDEPLTTPPPWPRLVFLQRFTSSSAPGGDGNELRPARTRCKPDGGGWPINRRNQKARPACPQELPARTLDAKPPRLAAVLGAPKPAE